MATTPKIGIVSLNWNGVNHLKKFLPTAINQDYPNFIIIIVDNDSKDGSVDFVRENYPEIHIVSLKENIGYSKGFNKGIFYAIDLGVEYLLITNNDVELHKEILKEGLKIDKIDFLNCISVLQMQPFPL